MSSLDPYQFDLEIKKFSSRTDLPANELSFLLFSPVRSVSLVAAVTDAALAVSQDIDLLVIHGVFGKQRCRSRMTLCYCDPETWNISTK